jgi:hypothetical protein
MRRTFDAARRQVTFPSTGPAERAAASMLVSFLVVDELLALIVFVGLVAVPYAAARLLVRVRMPLTLRLAVALAIPVALLWWLGTSPDFNDITSPGAALIPTLMIFGWLSGASSVFRQRLVARISGDSRS